VSEVAETRASSKITAVTGASGMLGRHVCADLLRRGFEVRALVRDPSRLDVRPGLAVGRCDLPETIDESLLAGASALVHCAYATRETDLEQARLVNEEGTRRLLEASRRAGIPRFVFISSVSAQADAPNYYARSKHAMEGLLDPNRDLIVRPGLILAREGHGLFQQMRDVMVRTHLVPLFGGGRQPLQTVHVDDLCEAIARALERGLTRSLNVGEPDPVSLSAFMRMLANRLRVRCLFLPLPFAPTLTVIRAIEKLRVPFPLRSESLLGIKALRKVPVSEDLRRLDLAVRPAEQSLSDVVSPARPA
jgi:nucleoside-diphosphate-sugar epimerase